MKRELENGLTILRELDSRDIQKYLKSTYPLIMIDHVSEIIVGKQAKGFKNFTNNEWYFPCHFPENPNVPGCLQLEIMIEMFILTFLTLPECAGKETADARINNLLFKKKIEPGDRLDVIAEITSFHFGIAKGSARGYLGGQVACSCDLIVAVPEIISNLTPITRST